ncbi:MAG: murein biosynthesis integral membrane protein MurJ, partial [Chloroflexota bacterium]|nr:murein biosynthesis integral membrane protein MurJ [Chloroflexota bacterium]
RTEESACVMQIDGAVSASDLTPEEQIEKTRRIPWVPRPPKAKTRRKAGDAPVTDSTPPAIAAEAIVPSKYTPRSAPANGSAPPGMPIPDDASPLEPMPIIAALPPSVAPPAAPPVASATAPAVVQARAAMGRAVAVVGLAFVANRVLGLLRDVIIAGKFGTGQEIDAYIAAFRIPDFLFLVIASGAFGAAFIPVFTGFLERDDDTAAWVLASSTLNAAFYALTALSAICFFFAGPLVRTIIAPDLAPAQQALATNLTHILLLQPLFLGLGGAAMGILNAQHKFLWPALAPVTYNLGIIFGALVLTPRYGVKGLAYGVVIGAAGHFLTQLPALARTMRYYPVVSLRVPGMRQVGALLIPRMFGQAVFALNFVIVTNFASRLGEGRISGFNYGYTLFLLPHGVFALSAATVLFPTLSRLAGAGDWHEFRAQYAATLRSVLFFVVPATAALITLRTAIPEAIYQLGAFNATSTDLTATALGALATGLIAYAVVEIVTRAFYALQDTRTPVIAGVLTIALNLPLSWFLSKAFGLGGLGLGLAVTTWLEMTILLVVLRRRMGVTAPGLADALVRIFWAAAAMTVALIPCSWLLHKLHRTTGKSIAQLAFFLVTLALGGAIYLGVCSLLGVEEVQRVRGMVLRRFGRRRAETD